MYFKANSLQSFYEYDIMCVFVTMEGFRMNFKRRLLIGVSIVVPFAVLIEIAENMTALWVGMTAIAISTVWVTWDIFLPEEDKANIPSDVATMGVLAVFFGLVGLKVPFIELWGVLSLVVVGLGLIVYPNRNEIRKSIAYNWSELREPVLPD